jgi:hypothetical protein
LGGTETLTGLSMSPSVASISRVATYSVTSSPGDDGIANGHERDDLQNPEKSVSKEVVALVFKHHRAGFDVANVLADHLDFLSA